MIKLDTPQQLFDTLRNETFFEAWTEYPFRLFSAQTTAIPVHAHSIMELQSKLKIAQLHKLLNDFNYLLRNIK